MSRRSISRKFDRFSGVLVVDIETEHRQNILDDSKIRAPDGVEGLIQTPAEVRAVAEVSFRAMRLGQYRIRWRVPRSRPWDRWCRRRVHLMPR